MNTHIANRRTRQLAAIIAAAALTAAACSSGGDEQATDGVASVATTEAASTSGTEPAATTTKPPPSTTTTTIVPLETIPYWAYDPDAPESVSPEYSGDSGNNNNTASTDNGSGGINTDNTGDSNSPRTTRTTTTNIATTTTSATNTTKPATTTTRPDATTTTSTSTTSSTSSTTTSTTSIPVDVELGDASDVAWPIPWPREDENGNVVIELTTYTGVVVTDEKCQKALLAWYVALLDEPDGLIASDSVSAHISDMTADQLRALRKASDIARIAWRNAHRVCGEVVDDVDGLFHANGHEWAHLAVQGSGLLDVEAALKGYWCTIDMHEANEHRGSLCDEVNDPYIAPHRRDDIYAPSVYE